MSWPRLVGARRLFIDHNEYRHSLPGQLLIPAYVYRIIYNDPHEVSLRYRRGISRSIFSKG